MKTKGEQKGWQREQSEKVWVDTLDLILEKNGGSRGIKLRPLVGL